MSHSRMPGDLAGYWRLVKCDNMDSFLREQGFPWIVRKTAVKFGSSGATDLVWQSEDGGTMKIVSVNAKGSWQRKLVVGKVVSQRNAVGAMCNTTCWWDGKVHKMRMEQRSGDAAFESWRYLESGVMVVKSIFSGKGREATMYWYFEPLAQAPRGQARVKADQRRVMRVTARDDVYLQRLVTDSARWTTPADDIIGYAPSQSTRDSPRKDATAAPTPGFSVSPLSGSRQGSPRSSSMASPQDSLHASVPLPPVEVAAQADQPAPMPPRGQHGRTASQSSVAQEARSEATATPADSLYEMEHANGRQPTGEGRRSFASADSGAPRVRGPERGMLKSPSSGSLSALARGDAERPGTTAEVLLSYLIQEFGDNRSITSVVPLETPADADEPDLLALSPEQAEETQLKLQQLEAAAGHANLKRASYSRGWNCIWCTCVCHRRLLPDYLREWDLSHA